jgi:excisionase family DNA binding protein
VAGEEISVREAARRTRRSEETIRRWIWSGRLPARKDGNSYRVDTAHLERIAVVYAPGVAGAAAAADSIGAWLDEVDQWKANLPVTPGISAADLVIEDRRARR